MKYRSLGWDSTIACTPVGCTMFDNRSCRQRTGCTKECIPKTLKCNWCESMNSSLNVFEEIETGNRISVCNKCMEIIIENIIR